MTDPKAPFFHKPTAAKPVQVTMPLIQFMNDSKYRASFGEWLYQNYESLTAEYKKYGRFLTLQEIEDGIL